MISILLLVGGLEHFLFSHIFRNVIIPIDEVIFFRGVAPNHQPETYLNKLKHLGKDRRIG